MGVQSPLKRDIVALALAAGLLAGCNQSSGGGTTSGPKAASTAATTPTTSATTPATRGSSTTPVGSSSTTGTTPGSTPSSTAARPTLSAVTPSHDTLAGGTILAVAGQGFAAQGAGTTLVLFGATAVPATVASDSELKVTLPAAAAAGPVDVRVVNDLGTAVLAGGFTYDPAAPALAFSPAVGHDELGFDGTKITLTLTNFPPLTPAATVAFGSGAGRNVAFIDSATILAEVPQGAQAGTVAITVTQGTDVATAPGFVIQGALNYGDLIVNEFCPNPAGCDNNRDGTVNTSTDEFVEIVNTTAAPVDLSYLTLHDSSTIERHRFTNPTTLPAGGAIVVFGAGTPTGFARLHATGSACCATSGDLGLNNTGDTVEIRTLPGASLSGVGTTIFKVVYTTAPTGPSLTNKVDGQKITSNPATNADYVDHSTVPGSVGKSSPGVKADGTSF